MAGQQKFFLLLQANKMQRRSIEIVLVAVAMIVMVASCTKLVEMRIRKSQHLSNLNKKQQGNFNIDAAKSQYVLFPPQQYNESAVNSLLILAPSINVSRSRLAVSYYSALLFKYLLLL